MKRKQTKTDSPDLKSRLAVSATSDSAAGLALRTGWWSLVLVLVTLGMMVVIFAPIDCWPLAYVCFVPWLVVVGADESPRRVYWLSYLLGVLFFSIATHWLFIVTVEGTAALFLTFGIYFPLVACPVRSAVRRRGWPLALVFPLVWVGFEAVRSICILEFPWNLLGHSQHSVLTMIQISDLVGAYGVSFVLAAVNGAVADVVLCRYGWPSACPTKRRRCSAKFSLIFSGVLMVATIGYGQFQLHRDTMRAGPRVAVLQGNYPNYVDQALAAQQPTSRERAKRYFELLLAASHLEPDLYLLPETPWPMYLNLKIPQVYYDAFSLVAAEHHAYVVTGSASAEETPLDLLASERRYNSAYVFSPDGGEPGRYNKNYLVLIGEYAPFRYGPLRFIYLWLNNVVPFGSDDYEYSLTPGNAFNTFTMHARSQGGKMYRFATPICYENVMPYVSRRFVIDSQGHKRCDFLLNLSNDGWFVHSWELPQHLAASVFRAVECRVGVARAVNTGISCFVDPDGRVHDMVEKNGVRRGPGVDGYRVANVMVDSRVSVYSRIGDVFAIFCALMWLFFYLDYIVARTLAKRAGKELPA